MYAMVFINFILVQKYTSKSTPKEILTSIVYSGAYLTMDYLLFILVAAFMSGIGLVRSI